MAEGDSETSQETAYIPAAEVSLLDRILTEGRLTPRVSAAAVIDATETEEARRLATAKQAEDARNAQGARVKAVGMVDEFVSRVVSQQPRGNANTTQLIEKCIADLDAKISKQLNEVIHYKDFQTLEAAWRGLNEFVTSTETGTMLKLRLLNVTKNDLAKDLNSATEFDQSALFKKIYEDEYGTFGGNPYSVMIADYEFGQSNEDIELLEKISHVAASAHAPFIASAAPTMFFMDGFSDIPAPRDLAKIFESTDFARWTSFRQSEDSRYVALTMPRVLQRLPYGKDTVRVESMGFEEDVNVDGFKAILDGLKENDPKKRKVNPDHKKYLWGSSAYKLGQRITHAYAQHGWTAAIRGVEGGGKVEGLPAHSFQALEGDKVLKCPTEVAITDRREKELNDLGFIALLHQKGTNVAAFFGGQTTQKPNTNYILDAANANARISAMLPYVMTASRFAHYIKVMMRDKIGSFMTRENVQSFLNQWIGEYVLGKDDAGQTLKARFPLREARVDVFDTPGKPGVYTATVFLRPHFQLEELTASIRLVAELPPPVAA